MDDDVDDSEGATRMIGFLMILAIVMIFALATYFALRAAS